jgi:imidazolonepropionase-like amidohydrolase
MRNPLFLALALLPILVAAAPARETVAITDVTVVDVAAGALRPHQTVVVAEARITAVAPDARVPDGARRLDGSGRFLIPGLWDMHVHLLWDPAIDTLPALCVANGVTGVRDMHTHFPFEQFTGWIREIHEGKRIGPRFFYTGPILDGPVPIWPGSIAVKDVEFGRQAVRDLNAKGVHFIKVYERLPREAYFAIADEARKQGLRFAGHVPEAVTPAEASGAGQASIEHLSHLLQHCNRGASGEMKDVVYDAARGAALFETFKRNGTWHCPTLIVAETATFGREERFANDPRRKYLTPTILSRVGFDDSKRDYAATLHHWREERKLMRDLHAAGVPLLAGTDAPIVRNVPGFSLHDELKCLVDAGLTPAEALRAATLNPARFLGMKKEMGTVEAGKRADLVLLSADPLADISNTTRIEAVIADGRLFDRSALDAILTQVESAARAERKSQHPPRRRYFLPPLPCTQGRGLG